MYVLQKTYGFMIHSENDNQKSKWSCIMAYINNTYIPSRWLTEKLFLSKIIICDLYNKYIWNLMKKNSKIDWKNGIYHIYYYRGD